MSDLSLELARAKPGLVEAARLGDYWALLKPRVMSLVVFTGFAGLLAAPGSIHPLLGAVAVLAIAVGAGAAGAINMYCDRDIDAVMARTRRRPIPAGRVEPADALGLGVALSLFSVMTMGLAVNWTAAALLAFANGFYVFVYTLWLKRRTPQNIVIGGLAGAMPPAIGWAAVTGRLELEALVLVAIIFLWTPPHFWALSLYRAGEYAKAGVPMLPVVAGAGETRRQILLYSLVLAPLAVVPSAIGTAGWIYGGGALALGAVFLLLAWRLYRDAGEAPAKRLFGFSILYLFLLFALLIVDSGAAATVWIG